MAMSEMILDWCTIYIFSGAFDPKRILPGAKFTFHSSLAFSYIGSITVRYSQCVSQTLRRGTRKAAENGVPFFPHLYLAGWPSCGTSVAHLLVLEFSSLL